MSTRISTAQIYQNSQTNVANAREKEVVTSEKASTMKEIVRPSQDPSGWLTASTLKDDLSARESIAKNAGLAMHSLNTTESIFTQMGEYVQKAHEIALAASGTDFMSVATRKHAVSDMKGVFDGAIQTLNTRYANRTLLAGLKTQGPAFDAGGKYVGDGEDFQIEIARGLVVPVNISGARAILGEGIHGGVNILENFQSLIAGLENDDPEMVRGTLDALVKAVEQVTLVRAELGGRMNQIQRALSDHSIQFIESKDAIAKIEEADAIKVFSELARDQAVLKASMSTTQKLLSENPVDILFK